MSEATMNSDEIYNKLSNEYGILHLIYHRNANQHGSDIWWKDFNILHRKLRMLLALALDCRQLTGGGDLRKLTRIRWNKLGRPRIGTRHLNARQAQAQIARTHTQILALTRYIRGKLTPGLFRQCYLILQTGQYITLGFALLALISRINYLLGELATAFESAEKPKQIAPSSQPHTVKPKVGIDEIFASHKSHKKDARSTMDDIFGF